MSANSGCDGPAVVRVPAPGAPAVVRVVVEGPQGPEGKPGQQGQPGRDGDGVTDPGDLTLIFDNRLI